MVKILSNRTIMIMVFRCYKHKKRRQKATNRKRIALSETRVLYPQIRYLVPQFSFSLFFFSLSFKKLTSFIIIFSLCCCSCVFVCLYVLSCRFLRGCTYLTPFLFVFLQFFDFILFLVFMFYFLPSLPLSSVSSAPLFLSFLCKFLSSQIQKMKSTAKNLNLLESVSQSCKT